MDTFMNVQDSDTPPITIPSWESFMWKGCLFGNEKKKIEKYSKVFFLFPQDSFLFFILSYLEIA